MRVGLMTPGLNPNDAVGNDLLGQYAALARRGVEAMVFTPTGDSDAAVRVWRYADADLVLGPDDLLLYHYCIGDLPALQAMRRARCRVVLKYHNVTPAAFLAPFSVEFARTSRIGRELLTELPELPIEGFIGDSGYNSEELRRLGAPADRLWVAPPFHAIDRLLGASDDPKTVAELNSRAFNIVWVGRIAPNKGLDLMLRSLARAVGEGIDAHLHIVGAQDPRLQPYRDLLERVITETKLGGRCTFQGGATLGRLASFYRHSQLFWTASQHEGFCVPAVEAMAFGLPVLSSREGALPETCGEAARYAGTTREFANQVVGLVCDDVGRRQLGNIARARYERCFRPAVLTRRFDAVLAEIDGAFAARRAPATLDVGDEWFELPQATDFIAAALRVTDPLPTNAFKSRDRRADFVDWILREGWRRSPDLRRRLDDPAFAEWADQIETPLAATPLTGPMRVLWRFHRFANARFDLQNRQGVADFLRWYAREGAAIHDFWRDDQSPRRRQSELASPQVA
ncbi:MAG TPA: glycosyltransferase [Caulobacteraceae bacterium]|nr:glycosyltransferase [Caulobacteraceae bacterium]